MLFRIDSHSAALSPVHSDWVPAELELEGYLVTQAETNVKVMSEAVFGEPLLFVHRQARTRANKRADIFALDRAGNGVIIELKRSGGRLGVETQALQYLADFSRYRGKAFFRQFDGITEDTVRRFLGGTVSLDNVNQHSRLILIAQSFDETIFSLGEWLSAKGVAVRCIVYSPAEIQGERLLSFSVAFDRSPESLYPVSFTSTVREPAVFWHNIGRADDAWWRFFVTHGQISAGFDNAPGDRGEKILTQFIAGDRIVAYAKRFGAVGWAVVEDPGSYRLLPLGHPDNIQNGQNRHRLDVRWQATAPTLKDGLSADEVRREFEIYHPISTSVAIDEARGEKLIQRLSAMFPQRPVKT